MIKTRDRVNYLREKTYDEKKDEESRNDQRKETLNKHHSR
jgi:hypothetical protein